MANDTTNLIVEELAQGIDISDTAYDKARDRYRDLAEWFERPESQCSKFDPRISPQGSFRLGTVIRGGEYDLDFGCRLRKGISKQTHTQQQLKALVGADIEEYRRARGIEKRLEEKRRCWRLKYKDELEFHMDGVPSIPEEQWRRQLIQESMVKFGADQYLAQRVVQFAGSITDNRMPNYQVVDHNWRISNSEGYALWFESRMRLARQLLENRAFEAKVASIDALPTHKWKSPLQRCVQILKCHRDILFADNPDSKPISIILTTLAGEAYQGEQDIADALETILTNMGKLVRHDRPRVPNPVNPIEDFADKWYDSSYRHLELEKNFWEWLQRAQADFNAIGNSRDADFISAQAKAKFGTTVNSDYLRRKLGIAVPGYIPQPNDRSVSATPAKATSLANSVIASASGYTFPNAAAAPSKPRGFA